MNFDLSEDEEMLKALTERFVANVYDHTTRRAFLAEPGGFSGKNWALLGELGLIAAPFPEESGGLSLDATGIATIFEALGRGMVVEPLAEASVLAGRLFALTAPETLKKPWLDGLLSGEKRLALAHAEAAARDSAAWVETSAHAEDAAYRLDGAKPYCISGGGADGYIVSARLAGAPDDPKGIALFLIPDDTPGLGRREWPLADGSMAVALSFEGVLVPQSHRLDGGIAEIEEAQQYANLARCAEALGVMERMFHETLDYVRTREQFGAALGTFQTIQHRMVAQYAAIEQSRALLNLALVSSGTDRFAEAVSGARAWISETSIALAHEMVQFHGGMGVTDELAIGAGHKRLLVLSRWPESPQATLDRYASCMN